MKKKHHKEQIMGYNDVCVCVCLFFLKFPRIKFLFLYFFFEKFKFNYKKSKTFFPPTDGASWQFHACDSVTIMTCMCVCVHLGLSH